NDISAVIEEGCKFEGNLSFNGIARIAGMVSGSIFSNDTVIISEGAVINADIHANVILMSGTVKGNIKAISRVEIIRPARFEGTITTPSLIVEEGVIFHGTTKMSDKH
ncbi:MAG: polymer-forming cytoskeletal protein, partial [Bacteriovoracaceae bacterium]|nr:polymer-forming cytoskeletal protein [Bacteriovoracaceae bacterium]